MCVCHNAVVSYTLKVCVYVCVLVCLCARERERERERYRGSVRESVVANWWDSNNKGYGIDLFIAHNIDSSLYICLYIYIYI